MDDISALGEGLFEHILDGAVKMAVDAGLFDQVPPFCQSEELLLGTEAVSAVVPACCLTAAGWCVIGSGKVPGMLSIRRVASEVLPVPEGPVRANSKPVCGTVLGR